MKEKGIILPIFSLPSKYGIGDFGNEAFEFIDILSSNNIDYWEILPINACNRLPYAPISYYALDENYISLDKLKEGGLIHNVETRESKSRVIYDNYKEKYYREAFKNFNKNEEYYQFIKCEEINEYAEYEKDLYGVDTEYSLFLQYILYKQWKDLKKYANSKGVKIIGDMPMYPAFESAETKYHPDYFEMENGKFTFEAGTPPDYFSSTGQKWGTPVYNVEKIKNDNYDYLIKRFKYHLDLYDKIRIDHFLGYDEFFKIPIGKFGTAGFYSDGLGYGFFDKLFENKRIKVDSFIVEDLGDIRDETIRLRDHYGFTGQRIIQSTIDLEKLCDDDDLFENIMIMPGNHDCHTIKGWYDSLNENHQNNLKIFLKNNGCVCENINVGILQYCFKCKAKIVMVMVQDILELDDNARINVPGIDFDDNWSWKLENFESFREKLNIFK